MKALFSSFIGGCLLVSSVSAETTIVSKGATDWKYLDTGAAPGGEWTTIVFDDGHWKTGNAPLGYETDGQAKFKTTIQFGGDENAKHLAAYFRKTFEMVDPATVSHLTLKIAADDGAVIHLNGKELQRLRMPTGEVTNQTLASEKTPGSTLNYQTLTVDPTALVTGKNVLAVSVHQSSATSSDTFLDLVLSAMSAAEIDAINFPEETQAIIAEHQEKMDTFSTAYRAAANDEEKAALKYPDPGPAQKALKELISLKPKSPSVASAAKWLMGTNGADSALFNTLTKHHFSSKSEDFASLLLNCSYQPSPAAKTFLKAVREKHPNTSLQAIATYALSRGETEPEQKEALLVEASENIGDISIHGRALSKMIQGDLFEMRHLVIGKVAPEIEGEDLDEVPFKLSEYRGKVVVLDFWGDW